MAAARFTPKRAARLIQNAAQVSIPHVIAGRWMILTPS